ncbi:MAG: hypothetical protein ACI9SC_003456, partial [Gammaproteobacteria bacterium]
MHRNIPLLMLVILNVYSINLIASSEDKTKHEINSASISRGQAVYKKSNCVFCHGWAGDGRGHPRSPGVAASLRLSVLDKDAMRHIIRCGLIGGIMPFHDRLAYRDDRCVAEPSEIDQSLLPQKGKNISSNDLDALVSYLMSNVQGRGEVTFEQCEAFYKPGSRNCLTLK